LGSGFLAASITFFPLEFFRQTCRPYGLSDAHFAWPIQNILLIRRHLRWFVPFSIPLVILTTMISDHQVEPLWTASLGRVSFIVLLAGITVTAARILRPRGGVFQIFGDNNPSSWTWDLRYVWFAMTIGLPVILILLTILGYHETARSLGGRLFLNVIVLAGLAFILSITERWFGVTEQSLEEQDNADAEVTSIATPEDHWRSEIPLDREALDITDIGNQTRRISWMIAIIIAALVSWYIWREIVPAFSLLDGIPVWPGVTSISFADLLGSAVAIMVTIIATRNIPGFLELGVLRRLPLDTGTRYAICSLVRYVLLATGFAVAVSIIGVTWTSVQWIFAAMGIGIGFGMQEIFANFISGIVLLFERPIRIGDIVTVDSTTGVVTKIRMRATVIVDWDRKELIVPNKDLITEKITNWTLSNQTNRIVIEVGVAYGSNTELSRKILLRVAREHRQIVSEPVPIATFEGFGDNSLNLVLRCYLHGLENRMKVITELYSAIDQAFRNSGIEIAFPQRDIHIRSIKPALHTIDDTDATSIDGIKSTKSNEDEPEKK